LGCRRDPKKEGAPKGQIPGYGMKLSGQRTVTHLNPGELQASGLDTEGDKSRGCRGIISQVKGQEEGKWVVEAFPPFYF